MLRQRSSRQPSILTDKFTSIEMLMTKDKPTALNSENKLTENLLHKIKNRKY